MPQVIVTSGASADLRRCRQFLLPHGPEIARRAAATIASRLRLLETAPLAGRPVADRPDMRELVIPFGKAGYVALCRHDPERDTIYILALRHQREAGFPL